MSECFEEAYRDMIDSEIPDLWDRIEAQLPEREPAQRKIVFTRRRVTALATAAAAVFCLLVVRPLVTPKTEVNLSAGPASENSYGAGAEKTDNAVAAAADRYEAEAAAEACEVNADVGTQDAPAAAEDVSSFWKEPANREEVQGIQAVADETYHEVYQAVVQLLDSVSDDRGNLLYKAQVLQPRTAGLSEGQMILLYFPEGTDVSAAESGSDLYFVETGETARDRGVGADGEITEETAVYQVF